jgi:hypothetical protein
MGRCDGRVIHLGDLDVFFVLINLFSKFLLRNWSVAIKGNIKIRGKIRID